jgi:hypothetical protein
MFYRVAAPARRLTGAAGAMCPAALFSGLLMFSKGSISRSSTSGNPMFKIGRHGRPKKGVIKLLRKWYLTT